MNMGGAGLLLRTVARAVGPATGANPVVTASGASIAICSACGATRQSLRSTCNHVALSHPGNSGGSHQQLDHEDWELAEFSSQCHIANDSLSSSSASEDGDNPLLFASGASCWPNVFGMPPSLAEAEEATLELEAALAAHAGPLSNVSSGSQSYSPTNSTLDGSNPERRYNDGFVDWIEPRGVAEHRLTRTARNPLHEALHLLENDPNVKGAVMSIVTDPDVWEAVMKNKNMQELKRKLQQGTEKEDYSVSAEDPEDDNHDSKDWISSLISMVHSIVGCTKQVGLKVQEEVCRIVRLIVGVTNKGWESVYHSSEDKEDPFERTIRSSMALAVLVFAIVILKRFPA